MMNCSNSNNKNELVRSTTFGDTTLRLDCFRYPESESAMIPEYDADDGCRLVLGLGPCGDYYSVGGNRDRGFTALLNQKLASEHDSILKLGLSGSTDDVSNTIEISVTNHHPGQLGDEGSTSAKKSGGYMPSLLLAPRMEKMPSQCHLPQMSSEPSSISDYSRSTVTSSKKCKFPGCTKGARGATGLCIGHGGGQRCQKPGCNKGAESRTAYCKSHGGGKRCAYLGCTKSAEGKTDYCIAHGGGRRCGHAGGCTKAARGKSGLCIKHGGGKRCKVEGCARSAEGQLGLCISHGGGRRCQYPDCSKGAQGSTTFCKGHGGGKRCVFAGCTKGAEGSTPLCKAHGGGKRCLFDGGGICPKSVHGGTSFCVAHGGGKRCAVPGCTKSARGRTDCCVRHGGGKRCKIENCGKSAQGSTSLCKAHGGGKRCSWGEGKCEKFARGKGGLCASHSSLVRGTETNKGSMIGPGLFQGLVPSTSSSIATGTSDSVSSFENAPLSMKALVSCSGPRNSEKPEEEKSFAVPEGRVHGGGLLSLFGGDLKNAIL